MINNKEYIDLLKSIITCINHGDYYSVKELSNLELNLMEQEEENIKKVILKIKKNKKMIENKEKALEKWPSKDLKILIEKYSEYTTKIIEKSNNIEQLKKRNISIYEFLEKI